MLLVYHHYTQDQYVELSKRSAYSGSGIGIGIFIFIAIVIFVSMLGRGSQKSKNQTKQKNNTSGTTLGSINLQSRNRHQSVVSIQQQQQQQQQSLGTMTNPENDYVPPYTQTPNDNDLGRFDKQGNFHASNRPENVLLPSPPPPVYLST
ncbi:conserved hypothetical protein [Candida dubliniensis CD36]|uniref:Uncharacterized protein n=1 Tax=Candida dubliniensis (strain CD36 / ATCC MYA-646 / CBS 7987 / NCPF 3949 / NRRL Y-17841) TaxID=573826 RepID=B9WCA4_CANDC|nr:conserved hypothetical protein [Candida dubliniensis CD36]CAX44026.1 conserved hypothetical protein [Candida dubliniensis CD36]